MRSAPTTVALASLALSLLPSTGSAAMREALSLSELQGMQQTLFDAELRLLADGARRNAPLPYQTVRCDNDNETNYLRRRALKNEYSPEQIYEGIIEQAWDNAAAVRHPAPFLICTDDLEKVAEGALWMPTPLRGEACFVEMLSVIEARRLVDEGTVVQPVADVMKIDPNAVDVVTSSAWNIPFEDGTDDERQNRPVAMPTANEAKADPNWERTIKIHLNPSIWIDDDADLAHDVHALMSDVQRWAGFGWAVRHDRLTDDERKRYAAKSLSDMFSLTSTRCRTMLSRNHRWAFWNQALRNGMEADHACGDMFAHMQMRPSENELGGRYRGAELVLNPEGGPPPRQREGSAANPACVLSLLAGLAAHPRVLAVSVDAPVPARSALE